MVELPTGTVTFLFTDVEGSTRLWDELPEAMRSALARHDELLRGAVAAHAGFMVKTTGDGAHAAFATAGDAVRAALAAQLALRNEAWGDAGPLRVRMGLHTGDAEVRDRDYFGTEVNRAARLMAVAHGGQVVCSRATADLARHTLEPGCGLVDLGTQQLRDLRTPEHVFQITHPELPADFPALRTLDVFPGNLPLQVTEFVGRDAELVELAKLLSRSRSVTLTGSAGVGKTRLALQAAAGVVPDYAGGAWFVDLAAVDDDALVATAIAATIGLPEHRGETPDEALVGALAHRRALVVLDNCEHLVDTVARIVDLIVHRCPLVTVLATSQEGLGVDGEATFPLRPLPESDAEHLFVERAVAARHGFEISGTDSQAIAELCRRLDGIPLAIELAAARVASMSPVAILERIDERFRLLGQGRRTARRRHQTLRAAVDWSYGLLSDSEQRVFERLAVFAGSFTLEVAERVVSDDLIDALDVIDLVTALVARSMVQLDERATDNRYRLLETLRDYGLERLAERGDVGTFRRRHAAHYLDVATEAAAQIVGADDIRWLAQVDDDLPNFRAALVFARDSGDQVTYVALAYALGRFWHATGTFREGLEWMSSALAIGEPVPPVQLAEMLALAGNMAVVLDRYDEGVELLERSLSVSRAAGEPAHPLALLGLGLIAMVQNRPDEACRYDEEAVAVARAGNDRYELARALTQAAPVLGLSVEDGRGLAFADEGVVLARELGNDTLLAMALQAAGIVRNRVDPATAVELLAQSFELPGSTRRRVVRAYARSFKAVAHVRLRQVPAAAQEVRLALPALQEGGELYQLSIALGVAAMLLARQRPETAVRLLALLDQLRVDGRFLGAAADLASQARLRDELEDRLGPAEFATRSAEGRAMTLAHAVAVALDELAPIAESA
jgi:predicted ATPase/class 3 adenylate cyclase